MVSTSSEGHSPKRFIYITICPPILMFTKVEENVSPFLHPVGLFVTSVALSLRPKFEVLLFSASS